MLNIQTIALRYLPDKKRKVCFNIYCMRLSLEIDVCFACLYHLFAASILELFTIEMLALLRLTCKMIFDVHHRGILLN
jgi:hypothetical protein